MYSTKEWPIDLDMACHKALSVVACTFEFTNVADEDYYILKRDSPLVGGLYTLHSLLSIMKVVRYNTKVPLDSVFLQQKKTSYSLKQVRAFLQPFKSLMSSPSPLMVSTTYDTTNH